MASATSLTRAEIKDGPGRWEIRGRGAESDVEKVREAVLAYLSARDAYDRSRTPETAALLDRADEWKNRLSKETGLHVVLRIIPG